MGNMSYCRMENTYNDLKDVRDNWEETSSKSELEYRDRILKLCRDIIKYYDEENSIVDNERLGQLEEAELKSE